MIGEPEPCGCCEINDYDGDDYEPCRNCGHSPEEHEPCSRIPGVRPVPAEQVIPGIRMMPTRPVIRASQPLPRRRKVTSENVNSRH